MVQSALAVLYGPEQHLSVPSLLEMHLNPEPCVLEYPLAWSLQLHARLVTPGKGQRLLTFLLLQYLHAMAVRCLGACWLKAICCGPPRPYS